MSRFFNHQISDETERSHLRHAGFCEEEIERLFHLRQRYEPTEQDRMVLEPNQEHLCFLRWLVQNGKLIK